MKNKIFALLTAAEVGIMSIAAGTTVCAEALDGDICPNCGDYGVAPMVNATEIRYFDEYNACKNGYKDHGDVLAQWWERVSWYCGDCDIHWEYWQPSGFPYWECPYD